MSGKLPMRVVLFGNDEMTSCRGAMKHLQAAIDGELEPELQAQVIAHLEACLSCGMHAQTYRDIKASILRSQRVELDSAVIADLENFARQLGSDTVE